MKICYCYADQKTEWNCSQYLAIDPMEAINKTGIHSAKAIHIGEFTQNSPEVQEIVFNSDIVMLERNLFHDALTLMQFYKVRGVNFGIMFDDGYTVIHPKNVSYNFWKKGEITMADPSGNPIKQYLKPNPLTQLSWGIAMSKGLQTVSQAIVDDWKHVNDGYIINHNVVMDNYKGNIEPLFPHDKNEIWIGWSGSMSHVDSFESSGLLRAFKEISKKYKNVKIIITGDRRVYDLVQLKDNSKKLYSNFVPKDVYPALLKSLDIFTIPLAGEYDKRRSQIKPTEASALKIPFLATDFPNYAHIKPYGNFTENGWENWFNKLSEMIDNYPKYKQQAEEVDYKWGESQDINLHIEDRIKLYQHLIEKPYKYEYPPTKQELENI